MELRARNASEAFFLLSQLRSSTQSLFLLFPMFYGSAVSSVSVSISDVSAVSAASSSVVLLYLLFLLFLLVLILLFLASGCRSSTRPRQAYLSHYQIIIWICFSFCLNIIQ